MTKPLTRTSRNQKYLPPKHLDTKDIFVFTLQAWSYGPGFLIFFLSIFVTGGEKKKVATAKHCRISRIKT
jgi:hypothetical protein